MPESLYHTSNETMPEHVWVDASVLLHDFMYRNPDVAAQRNVVPQQAEALAAYRKRVHLTLEHLAISGTQVHTTTAVLWRLSAVLSEWYLPALTTKIELQYLLSNYHVHDQNQELLEEVLAGMGTAPVLTTEEASWQHLGNRLQIRSLLTCLPLVPEYWTEWEILKPEHIITAN